MKLHLSTVPKSERLSNERIVNKRYNPCRGRRVSGMSTGWSRVFSNRRPDPDKEPFTVLIPPPNVTGVLPHGAHAEQSPFKIS